MKTSKHGLFVFPPKKTLIWRRHCSICQLCCRMTSKRSIDWFPESYQAWSFLKERSLNQPKAERVCFSSINQSNRSISVRLLFLFCLCVFISRSYENRSLLFHTSSWRYPDLNKKLIQRSFDARWTLEETKKYKYLSKPITCAEDENFVRAGRR